MQLIVPINQLPHVFVVILVNVNKQRNDTNTAYILTEIKTYHQKMVHYNQQ